MRRVEGENGFLGREGEVLRLEKDEDEDEDDEEHEVRLLESASGTQRGVWCLSTAEAARGPGAGGWPSFQDIYTRQRTLGAARAEICFAVRIIGLYDRHGIECGGSGN